MQIDIQSLRKVSPPPPKKIGFEKILAQPIEEMKNPVGHAMKRFHFLFSIFSNEKWKVHSLHRKKIVFTGFFTVFFTGFSLMRSILSISRFGSFLVETFFRVEGRWHYWVLLGFAPWESLLNRYEQSIGRRLSELLFPSFLVLLFFFTEFPLNQLRLHRIGIMRYVLMEL